MSGRSHRQRWRRLGVIEPTGVSAANGQTRSIRARDMSPPPCLSAARSWSFKAYLIAQDINQLYAHYGRDEAITSTCHVQCAFAPNRIETAEHLSKLTGQTTVVKEQVTTSGRGWSTNVSRSTHEVSRPLLTSDEAMRMKGARKNAQGMITKAGNMVIYVAGYPAIMGLQPLYFQDAELARRARIPTKKLEDTLATASG